MRVLCLALALLIVAAATARADIRATTEDGRSVLLKDDGTYEYVEPVAAEHLSDEAALVLIVQEIGRVERSMTGASCLGPETFSIAGLKIAERQDSPNRVEIMTDVTVKANGRVPNGSSWDTCFEFAFGGNGAEDKQEGSGKLRFVFVKSADQWRLE